MQFLGSQATQRPARIQETQGNGSESVSYTDTVNIGKTEACDRRCNDTQRKKVDLFRNCFKVFFPSQEF